MRALIIFTALLLNSFAYAQTKADPKQKATQPAPVAAPAATAEPAPPAEPAAQPTPTDAPAEPPAEETGVTIASQFRPGAFVNPGLTYFKRDLENPTPAPGAVGTAEVSTLQIDAKGGYIFDFGLIVGANLSYSTGKSGTDDINMFIGGPMVGYSDQYFGFFITATYHVFGTADWDTMGKYDKLSGLQVDLGYPMEISETIKLGPQISIRSIKHEDNTLAGDYKSKDIIPSLGLWFYF